MQHSEHTHQRRHRPRQVLSASASQRRERSATERTALHVWTEQQPRATRSANLSSKQAFVAQLDLVERRRHASRVLSNQPTTKETASERDEQERAKEGGLAPTCLAARFGLAPTAAPATDGLTPPSTPEAREATPTGERCQTSMRSTLQKREKEELTCLAARLGLAAAAARGERWRVWSRRARAMQTCALPGNTPASWLAPWGLWQHA